MFAWLSVYPVQSILLRFINIQSTGTLQQCEVIALPNPREHFTKRIPKSEQPSTVLTNCNCHKYP